MAGDGTQAGNDSQRLDGSVAVVTGASRGIGRACATALAGAGAEVVLMARSRDPLEEAAREIEAAGGKARAAPCDIRDSARVRATIGALERLDILVNNAGVNRPHPFLEVTEEVLDDLLTLNVRACFIVAQEAARRIVAGGRGGVIINVGSTLSHVASRGQSAYSMTKHAVDGMTKAMALDLAPHGIRVVNLCPTFTETDMTRERLADPEFHAGVVERIPLGKVAQPKEVARAAVFLASPAAGMITGTSLLVDGGWTAQ